MCILFIGINVFCGCLKLVFARFAGIVLYWSSFSRVLISKIHSLWYNYYAFQVMVCSFAAGLVWPPAHMR